MEIITQKLSYFEKLQIKFVIVFLECLFFVQKTFLILKL